MCVSHTRAQHFFLFLKFIFHINKEIYYLLHLKKFPLHMFLKLFFNYLTNPLGPASVSSRNEPLTRAHYSTSSHPMAIPNPFYTRYPEKLGAW